VVATIAAMLLRVDVDSMIKEIAIAHYRNSTHTRIMKTKRNDKNEKAMTIKQQNDLNLNLFSMLQSTKPRLLSNTALPFTRIPSSASSSSKFPGLLLLLSFVIAGIVFLSPALSAWAEDGHGVSERGSGGGGARSTAKSLGWVAIGAGLMANVPFLAFVRVKKLSVVSLGGGHEITRGLAIRHPTILNFHMAMNAIGFVAGMTHGILLIRGLDAISLALAITMTVLVASGLVLRFAPWKNGSKTNLKNYARIFHSQFVLSGLLVLLVILHLVSVGALD
jgi:hypothetical protein